MVMGMTEEKLKADRAGAEMAGAIETQMRTVVRQKPFHLVL